MSQYTQLQSNLTLSDFRIEVPGTGYSQQITSVENLPTTVATARTTLTFTHPALSNQSGSALAYTKGSNALADMAGNEVDSFNQSIGKSVFITLDLAEKDDLGGDQNDNYTRFNGSTLSIVVSLTNGARFSNGDVITLYRGNSRQSLKTLTVSSHDAGDTVVADGEQSFTVALQNSVFIENGVTSLSAAYAPVGTIGINKIGGVLRVTVDTEAPKINVSALNAIPASSKEVSAVDEDDVTKNATAATEWFYKQIKSGVVCGDDALKQNAQKYNEGKEITFKTEDDNNTKVCFSSTDLAGNVTYAVSDEIIGIDTKAPTVSKVAVTGSDTLTVTMSENVYAEASPDADDFVVFVNDTASATEFVDGIQNTAAKARSEFTVTTSNAFSSNDTVSLSYIQPTRTNAMIKDTTGKSLASFDKISATLPVALNITLDPAYDTGENNEDGLTRFGDDDAIGFTLALGNGSFKNSDAVNVYRNNEQRALATATIGIRDHEINAGGQESFTLTIPKNVFTEGAFTLYATHTRSGKEGLPSTRLSITYDMTAPAISIDKITSDPAKQKTVRATDGDDEVATTWKYKQITGTKCDKDQMDSGTTEYDEGKNINFKSEDDNGTKVCFAATDVSGNTSYRYSSIMRGIDTTPPSITVTNPDVTVAASKKKVSATDEGGSIHLGIPTGKRRCNL